jgi:hypothetical protein
MANSLAMPTDSSHPASEIAILEIPESGGAEHFTGTKHRTEFIANIGSYRSHIDRKLIERTKPTPPINSSVEMYTI